MRSAVLTIFVAFIFYSAAQVEGSTVLSLEEAIEMSRDHSYAIKSSVHDSLAAAHDVGAAGSLRFPSVSLNAVSFYIDDLQTIELPFNSVEIGTHENYQADMRLNLPLYTGGKISNQVKIQRELALSKNYTLEATRAKNAYLARKGYLNLMLSRTVVKSAEASLARIRLINQDISNLYANGMADSADLLETELALQKARQALEEKRTAGERASLSLNRLLGIDPGEEVILSTELPDPHIEKYEGESEKAGAIRRAELKALESRGRAAELLADFNKSRLFPNLSGYVQYSYGKPNKDIFNKTWNDYWAAGLNLNWEFNLGGGEFKNVYSANEQANSVKMLKKETEESFTLQSDIALKNLDFAYRIYEISQKEFNIARRQYQLAEAEKIAGNLSLNRLLEMESDLTGAEQVYRVSIINYYISETEYLYAMGSSKLYGGF
jgi:outer membrane protein TolC